MKSTSLYLKAFALLFCTAFAFSLHAQVGGAFFADFHLSGKARQIRAYGMVQDYEGNMHMATLGGVVVFDGTNTTLVGTGAGTNVLEHVTENMKTYAGCDGRIGFIKRNNFGKFVFNRIPLDGMDEQSFANIYNVGKDVYFQSSDWVIKVTDEKITGRWKRPNQGNFAGIFAIQNVLFVNVSSSGLYTLESGGKFKKVSVDDSRIAEQQLMFCTPRASNEMMLGTDANEIYIFNGTQVIKLPLEKQAYLESKFLVSGKRLNDKEMAISTFAGGLMVANMYSGLVTEMYNTGTGFPVDEVNCITIDKNQGVWASHELGITRIDRNIPVKYFSAYPGLNSRVYSVAEANGNLFAGCADGLYLLKPVESMAEYEAAINRQKQINRVIQAENRQAAAKSGGTTPATTNDEDPTPDPAPGTPTETPGTTPTETTPTTPADPGESAIDRAGKRIKDVRSRIRDRVRTGTGTDKGVTNPKGAANFGHQKGLSHYQLTREKSHFHFAAIGQNRSSQFVYTKIEGISSKVRKILATPTGLVCATNTGLYIYSAAGVRNIFTGDIKDAVYAGGKVLFVGPSGPYLLEEATGKVVPISINSKYRNLSTVFLENSGTAWLGGINYVLRLNLDKGGNVTKEKMIEVPTEFPDNIHICKSGNVLFFASGGGIFEYQTTTESAVQANIALPSDNEVLEYRVNPSGNTLFVKTLEGWKEVKNHSEQVSMGLLDVLESVTYVFKSSNGNLWTVSNSGSIYYLNRNAPAVAGFSGFDVFFRGVSGFNGNAFDLSDLSISYKEAAVEIKWGSNLYLQSDGTWYQFKIQGASNNQWSQWTKQTSYKIQLNPGRYTFIVRARDILGNISAERKLSFYIEPPFWQTWWFYTLMAIVMAGAIYFIFRWRNRALIENQKRLESMVKERTLELAEEKEKTEELLLNILPKAVAHELKTQGRSSVRRHSDSAVMFTDFCNFTKMSMNMSAEELVERLDSYFRKFDEIVDKYALEKIKTIGDAYMCAAGVPQPRVNSSLAIVMAALEILEVVENADSHWQIRVGIHHGGLVSGVVGKRKFAYDIWGDTVNVASRMESSSEPMNINVTEQVYNQIKDYFECEKRGEIEAKSLGKTNMYFVKGLKTKYRVNGSAIVPNKEFLALLD